MTGHEYENQLWLVEWLKNKVKYQEEEHANIQKNKQKVKRIDFSWHNLKGKFTIADFPSLTTLNLGNNSLEEIEIKNCPHLRNIIVSHNQKRVGEEFTFVDEWENTRKYQINKEVGPTLEKLTITDCPEVRELYCSNNALTDLDISQLNQLTVLSYSDNKLSESKQAELAAKNLLESNPTGIPIKTFDDDFFIDNEEIIEIDISSEVGWEGKLEVRNCPKLTSLVVDNCKLDELVIENCPNLKLLSFRHNRVGIIDLSGLPNLENLYCSGNELEELDLSENTKLKNLVCDNNFFEKLDVKHLSKLESLYCFRCGLEDLDCSGLNELKELYCANNVHEGEEINYRLSKISIEGCDKLEILDCAENNIEELNISNLSKLKQVSCRESKLISINASNCVSLEYLDFSSNFCLHTYNYDGELKDEENCSLAVEEVILDNCPKLSKVFASESFDYDLTKLPNLKILRIDDKETDFVALRNTEKVEQILTNPQDYSIDQIIKLELYGVSSELREKLIALVKQKYEDEIRRKFGKRYHVPGDDWENPNQKKKKTKETLPPLEKDDSLNEDKDQIILALQQKNAELETKIKALETDKNNPQKIEEIRNEILNSELSEEQKQELLKLLEDKKKVSEIQPKPTNYWPWIIGGSIVISAGWALFAYLLLLRKRKRIKTNTIKKL